MKREGIEIMAQNDEVTLDNKSAPSGEDSKSKVMDDLAAAIEFLEPGKPLILNDGFLVTDSGNLIWSQYVDIGMDKKLDRPATLVKSIEAEYGLEHAPTIQLSAPIRFRDYGETFIRDKQEGHAQREMKTESPARSYEEQNLEQETALSLLGQKGLSIRNTKSPSFHNATQSITFGRKSWIYCTSIDTTFDRRNIRRAKFPFKYNHESVIRQPRKFALALGEMFADQQGPQGQRAHFTHPGGFKSFHDCQCVMHGPVWYTDDVFDFLESRQSEPMHIFYPLFVKHSEYQDLQEYRFILHCETPVEAEVLHLNITGAMRDASAPPRAVGHVTFQLREEPSADSSSTKVSGPTQTHRTKTQTRSTSNKKHRTLSIKGDVIQEETITSEQTIKLTTELPADGLEHSGTGPEAPTSREGEVTETEIQERWINGSATDKMTSWRTRVFTVTDSADAEKMFTLEEQDHAVRVLEAAQQPFANFSKLPSSSAEALKALAHQATLIEPKVEVQAMSACWNGIWAICNLYERYGDVVASVGIEHDEFVAITLKQSEGAGTAGKILVGPRGTFAYMLTRGDEKRPGYGGIPDRLVFFPDEEARTAFEEFGWNPPEEQQREGMD